MRIGIITPPFISVPPTRYGGTELFVAHLAEGLQDRGHEVTVYATGDSRVRCRVKSRYAESQWPIRDPVAAQLRNHDHTGWAMADAVRSADILHVNDCVALPFTLLVDQPVVLTLHHPNEPVLAEFYAKYPAVHYVAISAFQATRMGIEATVVYHGIDTSEYAFSAAKQDYLVFLGRMAPCKGAHLAIQAARRSGLRLILAGEIQPTFRDYWERDVRPLVDGDRVQYVGEADKRLKNALLGQTRALLFPIQWDEPFGLVMIEAMACGTPVLALPGGSVPEIVRDGVTGWICRDVADMADRVPSLGALDPASCRSWVEERFSCARMVDGYLDVYEHALRRAGSRGPELAATA